MDSSFWDRLEAGAAIAAEILTPYGVGGVFVDEGTLVTANEERAQLREFHSQKGKDEDMPGTGLVKYAGGGVKRAVREGLKDMPVAALSNAKKKVLVAATVAAAGTEVAEGIRDAVESDDSGTILGDVWDFVKRALPGGGDSAADSIAQAISTVSREEYHAIARVGELLFPGSNRDEQLALAAEFLLSCALGLSAGMPALRAVALDQRFARFSAG